MLTFVAEIYHPSFLFDPNYSHDVNELSVSLTSYANFVVKGFFSVTVVKEMQVLLTTHKSTNFSNFLFLLISDLGSGAERVLQVAEDEEVSDYACMARKV